ncbi:MAG: hypothetical protein EOL95_07270 [Bacteroidia bacterium]|nr:hypothetical protein [Bacteroidia bacterium]
MINLGSRRRIIKVLIDGNYLDTKLEGVKILEEYPKIKTKTSSLSRAKREAVEIYVKFCCERNKEFEKVISKINLELEEQNKNKIW